MDARQPKAIEAAATLRKSSQVVKNRLSDNVGGVKFFLSTLRRALIAERYFALVDGLCFAKGRLARNRFRSAIQSDPSRPHVPLRA